jgi:hypothetical protein
MTSRDLCAGLFTSHAAAVAALQCEVDKLLEHDVFDFADVDAYPFQMAVHSRIVTTASSSCQRWFDLGTAWAYAFNHAEGLRCFARALKADPTCVSAACSLVYASGDNYNKQFQYFGPVELHAICRRVRAALAVITDVSHAARTELEDVLVSVQCTRYAPFLALASADDVVVACGGVSPSVAADGVVDALKAAAVAYAEAMQNVFADFGDDADVATLAAESKMNLRPWQLWANPECPISTSIAAMLEAAIARHPSHVGLLHLYIHLMEMSPAPEKALPMAAALTLTVANTHAGHLHHMPSHIDVLTGRYGEAATANEHAMVADAYYVEHVGSRNFYALYRIHNSHFRAYAAMHAGRFHEALESAESITNDITREFLLDNSTGLPMAMLMESYASTKAHVLIRFGKW